MKFLELLDCLIHDASQFRPRVEDMELIIVNMYHLLNTYRPHQARARLISMMEEQLNSRNEMIQTIDKKFAEVNTIMKNSSSNLLEGTKIANRGGLQFLQKQEDKMELEEKREDKQQTDFYLRMKAFVDQKIKQ